MKMSACSWAVLLCGVLLALVILGVRLSVREREENRLERLAEAMRIYSRDVNRIGVSDWVGATANEKLTIWFPPVVSGEADLAARAIHLSFADGSTAEFQLEDRWAQTPENRTVTAVRASAPLTLGQGSDGRPVYRAQAEGAVIVLTFEGGQELTLPSNLTEEQLSLLVLKTLGY